jgi:glucan phosphorylase
LLDYIQSTVPGTNFGDESELMVIGHTKRISVHKRHILSIIGIIDAWLRDDRRSLTVFAGKANPELKEEK